MRASVTAAGGVLAAGYAKAAAKSSRSGESGGVPRGKDTSLPGLHVNGRDTFHVNVREYRLA